MENSNSSTHDRPQTVWQHSLTLFKAVCTRRNDDPSRPISTVSDLFMICASEILAREPVPDHVRDGMRFTISSVASTWSEEQATTEPLDWEERLSRFSWFEPERSTSGILAYLKCLGSILLTEEERDLAHSSEGGAPMLHQVFDPEGVLLRLAYRKSGTFIVSTKKFREEYGCDVKVMLSRSHLRLPISLR